MCATETKARKPLTPVGGTCRWIEDANNGKPQLRINETTYEVHDLGGVGYRLFRFKDGDVVCYDVDTTAPYGWTCDCPDMTYRPNRPGGCKHVAAVKAALASIQ